MISVAYSTSRWDGNLYRDTTRVLLYDVRDEPYCALALPQRTARAPAHNAYRTEMTRDKFAGIPCPERNGDLTLFDAGPFRTKVNAQFHVKAQCSCGRVVLIRRGEWLNVVKKCQQRCTECSHKLQRGKR